MGTKLKNTLANNGATLAGLIVALANAWITIDWDNFQWTDGNIMKLSISGVIAAGGYFSQFKVSHKKKDENNAQN